MKYYFVVYEAAPRGATLKKTETVINKHPLIWLLDIRKEYDENLWEYRIIFYAEISKELWRTAKDLF